MHPVCGFSELSKVKKIDFLLKEYFSHSGPQIKRQIMDFWHPDPLKQKLFDEFSENTITNFYLPYGVVPNLLVNGKNYCVPMVTEESSVVAAAARGAKFWFLRGGFTAEILSTTKVGQVHFIWKGEYKKLCKFFKCHKEELIASVSDITSNMNERGGGLAELELLDKTSEEKDYYQLFATFQTCDAMGANFINSVLEKVALTFKEKLKESTLMNGTEKEVKIIMAILSNYTPECLVRTSLKCSLDELADPTLEEDIDSFVEKFRLAVKIAQIDPYRAVTNNKGIFNGIDAVALATGNDFRAIEACGHAYASRDGKYRGLTDIEVTDKYFKFSLQLPLSLGTIGGLTTLHPMAKISLDMLQRPSAHELMCIMASIGLSQNFSALRSLVTTGIQKGHMRMHLFNILNRLEANDQEREFTRKYFEDKVVSFSAVRDFLAQQRNYH